MLQKTRPKTKKNGKKENEKEFANYTISAK